VPIIEVRLSVCLVLSLLTHHPILISQGLKADLYEWQLTNPISSSARKNFKSSDTIFYVLVGQKNLIYCRMVGPS